MIKGQRSRRSVPTTLSSERRRREGRAEDSVSVLYYSDIHGGTHHDEHAVERLFDHMESERFDHIIDGGDRIDAYSVSKYDKDPRLIASLPSELDWSKEFSKKVEARANDAELHFCLGNHEQRIPDYVRRRAPGLEGLSGLKMPTLLGTEGWQNHGRPGIVIDGIRFKHGDKVAKGAGNSVRKELDDYWQSVVMGHCHRQAVVRVRKHREFVGVEAGCLCRLDPEYVSHPDWKQGWVVVRITPNGVNVEEHNP